MQLFVLDSYEALEQSSVAFAVMDERKREYKALRHLFELEWKKAAKPNPFEPSLKKLHRRLLKICTHYFFEYLLEFLSDSPEDYDACYRLLHPDTPDTVPEKTENTPEPENVLPPKGKYVELVAWLRKEKELGRDYLAEAGGNRTKMCRNLKKIIGWEPKPNSLGKQWNL